MRATRLLPLLLACATSPPQPDPGMAELRERVEMQGRRLDEAERRADELAEHINQASKLAALGGGKRRFTAGISCDPTVYLDKSSGWEAQQALVRCGMCEPAPLPVPVVASK